MSFIHGQIIQLIFISLFIYFYFTSKVVKLKEEYERFLKIVEKYKGTDYRLKYEISEPTF